MNEYFLKDLKEIFREKDIKINEPMKYHTSFKVGGPADCLVLPEKKEQILKVIELCQEYNIPYFIMGNGSNLLVRDGGIRGVVIKLTQLNNMEVKGETIVVQSGALLTHVSIAALKAELKGFEFACGIPGTVGGAVAMNAGAYDGEISQIIQSAVVIDNHGRIKNLLKDEMDLGYRNSKILKCGYTVLEATFVFEKGEYNEIKEKIDDLINRRVTKQPLEYASAGSTFKRPEGYFAGKLIQDSGLKGKTIGDAKVSVKHSGFIINKGNATAEDILKLIKFVQKTVKDNYGVELKTEVRIMGEETIKST
ncbi:UDP-N-acetylmuramate dehydrogenase [Clostridium sediminicola]|uniref:UDP-N-acetylmuramate dehydrogenase n=1 Tax=Clostridium sediminicola TaxID=3114879 RepID=UPI003D16839C